MSAIEVARLGPEDWHEFRQVRLASLKDAPGAFGSRYADWVDADQARWRARLTDVPLTLVGRSTGGPVGVASGADAGEAVELISMWVASEYRRTGLAGRLIGQVVSWGASTGRSTYLMVGDDNAAAIRAYGKAGFVDHGVPADWPAGIPAERRMWHEAVASR